MIVTLMGARQNLGVTILGINLSKLLSEERETILVDLNLCNPDVGKYLGIDSKNTVDDLMCLGGANKISEDVIYGNFESVDNLGAKVLCGTRIPDKFDYVEYKYVDKVLEGLKEIEGVVICDVHSELNNAGTVSAIINSDKVIVLVDQNEIILEDMRDKLRLMRKIEGVNGDKFIGVVNRYSKKVDLGGIGKYLGLGQVLGVRDMGDWFLEGILGGDPFITSGIVKGREQKKCIEDLKNVCKVLLDR